MLKASEKAKTIVASEIRTMSVECERLGGINLAQGICDTPTPDVVKDAARQAIAEGLNQYVRLDGIATLRQAIAVKLASFNRIAADAEREIVVTSGATGAFHAACMALLNAGDEVIVFEPFYSYHVNTLLAMGAVPVFVTMEQPRWELDFDVVRAALSPRTKAMVVNSPGNPSGKVFSRAEIEHLAELAQEHDLFVFTDEIYEYFVYEGVHVSVAALPGMRERTITISGFSKTFSVTGWRVGYLTCAARWKQAIAYFHDLAYVCAPSALQMGAAAGLRELGEDFYRQLAQDYKAKRKVLCDALDAAGLTPCIPQGAYYVLADASRLPGSTSKEKAMFLLEHAGVAAVPGDAFFHDDAGSHLLRFCFAKTDAALAAACERLSVSELSGVEAKAL